MTNSNIVIAYFIYLPIVLALTWYVARTLFQNGKVFMLDIFHGREDIAVSTNNLFEVGFYLLNIGFALFYLRIWYNIEHVQGLVEVLSQKIGGFSIYLGIMLFFNLYMFFRGRKASRVNTQKTQPIAPQS
ncbi:MAG: hypothetical protein RIR11_4323 [Bacteroidota bacterium]|jgi:hypothetical protein